MNNPWLNISWNNTIADCDKNYQVEIKLNGKKQKVSFGSQQYKDFINKNDVDLIKKKKKPVALRFDCLPEPFYGDPKSEVYCLCMNPGEPDPDFNKDNDEKGGYLYQAYCQAMLNKQPQPKELLYDRNKNKIIRDANIYDEQMKKILAKIKDFKKDRNNFCPRPHVGDVWQREVWKQLIEELGDEPKIFSIEFFPYHSTSGFVFPKDLPSYKYRNELIKEAMDKQKLIIIMRNRDQWYEIENDDEKNGLGPRLKRYANKVFLRNSQRVWLTPGNFCWEIPETSTNGYVPYAESWACHSVKDIIAKFK